MIGRWIFIRDARLSTRTKIVLAIGTLLALLAMLPLRLVLGLADPSGNSLRAQAVEGPAWNGIAGEMQVGGLPLGTLEVDLMPLPLLIGRAQFALNRPEFDGGAPFSARVRGAGGNIAIDDANGEMPVGSAMAPLPVRAISFADFSVRMREGRCEAASGTLGLIVPALGGVFDAETALAGEARCEDGALSVAMTGTGGNERVDFTLAPDGEWRADLTLADIPLELSAPLLDMGFTARGSGVALAAGGKL